MKAQMQEPLTLREIEKREAETSPDKQRAMERLNLMLSAAVLPMLQILRRRGYLKQEFVTDFKLLEQTKAARRASHDAPLARISDENKDGRPTGKRFISDHTNAWAMRSREWCRLADEVDRRGLAQPVMDWD